MHSLENTSTRVAQTRRLRGIGAEEFRVHLAVGDGVTHDGVAALLAGEVGALHGGGGSSADGALLVEEILHHRAVAVVCTRKRHCGKGAGSSTKNLISARLIGILTLNDLKLEGEVVRHHASIHGVSETQSGSAAAISVERIRHVEISSTGVHGGQGDGVVVDSSGGLVAIGHSLNKFTGHDVAVALHQINNFLGVIRASTELGNKCQHHTEGKNRHLCRTD